MLRPRLLSPVGCARDAETLTNPPSEPKLAKALLPASAQGTPQKARLVLAAQNPHLVKHQQSRQASQVSVVGGAGQPMATEAVAGAMAAPAMPAAQAAQAQQGMEHTRQLAEVLYGRWAEGLRSRWPQI